MKGKKESGWLKGIFKSFALENEFPHTTLNENQFVISVSSKFNELSTVFQLQDDEDGYEHLTPILEVPPQKRKDIAEVAISEAFREISPLLPQDDNRLFVYGSKTGLTEKDDTEIRDGILDVMGRVVGYDNEKQPFFRRILSKK